MRRLCRVLFALMAVAACLVSCSQEKVEGNGILQIEIGLDVSRGIQAISMETASYNITMKDSSEVVVFSSSRENKTSYSVSAPAGTYSITVEALNSTGDMIGTGSATAEVRVGQTNTVNITVSEPEGNGTFSMSITANGGYPISYSVRDASGTEVGNGTLSYSEGTYSASETLANGFYSFTITRTDTDKVIKTDTFRIIKDKTVSYSAEFEFLTDGTMVIVNEITATPAINITLNKSVFKTGDILTASATVSGLGEGFVCYWTIDGEAVTEAGSYDDLEYEITDSDEVEHEIALFAADETLIWSGSRSFFVNNYPSSINVSGDIEVFITGNVLVPSGTKLDIDIEHSMLHRQAQVGYFHIYETLDEESTITVGNVSEDGYFAYLETEFDTVNNRTIVYVVIDRFIENPAYLLLKFEHEYYFEENQTKGPWLHRIEDGNSAFDGMILVTNSKADRTLKVEPGDYSYNGSGYGSDARECHIDVSPSSFSVSSRETEILTLTSRPYGTLLVTAPDKYEIYELYYGDSMYPKTYDLASGVTYKVREDLSRNYVFNLMPYYGMEGVTSYFTATGTTEEGTQNVELEEVLLDFVDSGQTITGQEFSIAYDVRAIIAESAYSFLKINSRVYNMRSFNNGRISQNCENASLSIATGPRFDGYELSVRCEDGVITMTYDLPEDEYATINLVYDFEFDDSYGGAHPIVWLEDERYLIDLSGKPSSIKAKPGTYGAGGSVRYEGTGTNWVFVSSGFTVSAGQTITVHLKNELN